MSESSGDSRHIVLEDLTELICRFRPDGTVLYVNEVYCRFFGKTREEMVAGRWQPNAHPDDVPEIESKLRQLTPQNPVVVIENRVNAGTGEVLWMQFINRGFFDAEGRLMELQAVARDVTHRHAVEEELRRSRDRVRALEEELRRAIARELHDDVGTNLAALGMHLAMAVDALSPDSRERVGERLTDCQRLIGDITRAIRDMQTNLHPPVLDDYGLVAALRWLAETIGARSGLEVHTQASADFPRLAPSTELALFRITQEALSNVWRHARATWVEVELARSEGKVTLTIEDDGAGFDPSAPRRTERSGWGLKTMAERAEVLGGIFTVESSGGHGARIMVQVPEEG